jgi:UDP:flavonoid glycosyltransferase YjiC (YdhE family)
MSHGGAGTLLGAAARGVPQVVAPVFADHRENGVALTASGAGIMLAADQRSTATIRAALERALTDVAMREAAARVAAEIQAMPAAADHVPAIEALVPLNGIDGGG